MLYPLSYGSGDGAYRGAKSSCHGTRRVGEGVGERGGHGAS